MNKKVVFIFNIFIVSILLALNLYFVYFFNNIYLAIFGAIITIFLYISIAKSFVNDMYTTYENLQRTMQTTMHEINTPVSTILMNTHMLKNSCKNEIELKQIARIESSCNNLLELYQNMEYFLQKEINQIELVKFDIEEVILKSVLKFEDIKKDVQIIVDIKPFFIKIDKVGFEIIIDNLISNAIKHNETLKQINIYMKNNILKIGDDGGGIAMKQIYNTFNNYFVDNSKNGHGLGLGIVKEFCDKNNIEVHIDSSKNGTTVSLLLKELDCQ